VRVNKACARLQKTIPAELAFQPSYNEMYVDDARQYIYCLVSKASCTSWKRTLLKLSGNMTTSNKLLNTSHELKFGVVHNHAFSDRILKRLVLFTPDEIRFRLNNYFKFMFVREPFERLLSAYRDKMLRDQAYVRAFAPFIVKKYRNNTRTAFSEYTGIVFFSEVSVEISLSFCMNRRQNILLMRCHVICEGVFPK
jgi:hypothetical protein